MMVIKQRSKSSDNIVKRNPFVQRDRRFGMHSYEKGLSGQIFCKHKKAIEPGLGMGRQKKPATSLWVVCMTFNVVNYFCVKKRDEINIFLFGFSLLQEKILPTSGSTRWRPNAASHIKEFF